MNVTATASDNVAVVGVQFLLDGANLGAEDTTAPYSVAWNTVGATNGTHTLTARARDAAANTTTSAARTVTVTNAPASGLVAAYAFDEGSGTTVADASPSAVNATATSPTWTPSGRYGAAITFNGTSTRVARNSALTLPGAFTIEAWVLNPANTAFETIASVGSNRDLYLGNGNITLLERDVRPHVRHPSPQHLDARRLRVHRHQHRGLRQRHPAGDHPEPHTWPA